jgi:hypothetical protein
MGSVVAAKGPESYATASAMEAYLAQTNKPTL